jgi:HK97 family phage prohead protease
MKPMKRKELDNYMTVKEAKDGKLSAIASTPAVDRDGEVILPSAFANSLASYRANPVIMASHNHGFLSNGMPTIIGSAKKIEIEAEAMVFEMEFAKTEIAKAWQSLYEDGHARAFSVGFIPKEGDWKEQDGESIYVHTEVELLEISAVAVPANPEAVTRGFDPEQINAMVDARVEKIMEQWYAKRLQSIL